MNTDKTQIEAQAITLKPLFNAVAVYDKRGIKLSEGDSVKIECDYANDSNGLIKKVSLKYKGVKSEGNDFGKAEVNEYYSLLLDGEGWNSFILNNENKDFRCNSIIAMK